MGRLHLDGLKDFGKTAAGRAAAVLARGMVKGMARHWTIEDLREYAEADADLQTLEEQMPQLVASLHHMMEQFPAVRELTFDEVWGWIGEANPPLVEQTAEDDVVKDWLRRVWEDGRSRLNRGV